MSENRPDIERQVYRVSEVEHAMGWAHSTAYRLIARGEIAVVDTPIGKRITAAEFERLRGGKPLHIVHEPDPKRQAMAAHARKAKAEAKAETAKTVATADELAVFMDEVRRALPRIEAAVIERLDRIEERIAAKQQQDQAEGSGKTTARIAVVRERDVRQNFRTERKARRVEVDPATGRRRLSVCNAQHKIVLDGPAFNQPGILRRRESRNGTPSNRAGQADT